MEDSKKIPQQYINTPFAYTKFAKNLSLLQQSVLNKVSEHLQSYIQHYFGSDLRKSKDVPRPLFSDAEKHNGMPDFVVTYAELGVSINNYQVARAAVQEVMDLTVDAPGVDKDGNNAIIAYHIFTKANISSEESNGVVFSLNPEVVDYVFDMSQGYVRHPADIARIGRVERMPMMYYYLFKKTERWKNREVHLTVVEIKEYLGMRGKKVQTNEGMRGRPTKDGEIKESYPKFSKFNSFVLAKSIDDINRLKQEGLLDVCISYEPVYNGKRKVGNPAFIRFNIYDTIDEMQKATNPEAYQASLFAKQEEEKKRQEPVIEDYPGKYAEEWEQFLQQYDGYFKPWLVRARHYGANASGFISIRFDDKQTLDSFNAECEKPANKNEYDSMMRTLASIIGKAAARVLVRGVK
jgi:hypothetical protein